jgi:hypothetical protein
MKEGMLYVTRKARWEAVKRLNKIMELIEGI